MTDVIHTPPALRWVALFLVACGALGLFLGFRDQIRKNPPGWYTGAEQVAAPLTAAPDGAREAVAFDPTAARTAPASDVSPARKAGDTTAATPEDKTDAAGAPDPVAPGPVPPPVLTATPAPKLKPAPAAPRAPPPSDPVGDILESQKPSEPPPVVPY